MGKFGKILLGATTAVAVGAGLVWAGGRFSENRLASQAAEDQLASDREVTSGVATKLLWGDTHLHTANSSDAFAAGVRLGPEEALRFGSGEEVTSTTGLKAQLSRPLDFLVIADHSGALGATKALKEAPRLLIRDPKLRRWHDMMNNDLEGQQKATAELISAVGAGTLTGLAPPEVQRKRTLEIWTNHNSIVERYNEPGKFTAFVGFEYTLMPRGDNMHRVVIFRDGKSRTDQVRPYDPMTEGTEDVDKLWDYMDA